jgi:hypothetical protein
MGELERRDRGWEEEAREVFSSGGSCPAFRGEICGRKMDDVPPLLAIKQAEDLVH